MAITKSQQFNFQVVALRLFDAETKTRASRAALLTRGTLA